MDDIKKFVKEKRKQIGLTQVELAARAGVGLRFVRKLEQGKATLRCDVTNKVLALFGTKLGVVPRPRTLGRNENQEST